MAHQKFLEEHEEAVASLEDAKELVSEKFSYTQQQFELRDLHISDDYQVRWNGQLHPVTKWGFCNLLAHLGIPADFGLRIHTSLLQHNVEELKVRADKTVIAFLRDGVAVNFTDYPYPKVRNQDVIKILEAFPKLECERLTLSDRGMEISAISQDFPDIQPEIGDITKVGYRIANSETGGTRLNATFQLFRLKCKNGATLPAKLGNVRWSYDERMRYSASLNKFKEELAELSIDSKVLAERYKRLANQPLTDRAFISVWRAVKRVLGSAEQADSFLEVDSDRRREIYRIMRKRKEENRKYLGGDTQPPEPTPWTGYEIMNTITQNARDYKFSTQSRLEKIGGRMVEMFKMNKEPIALRLK